MKGWMKSALIVGILVGLAILVAALVGCGTLNPYTAISPPMNMGKDVSTTHKGGTDTSKTQTIRVQPIGVPATTSSVKPAAKVAEGPGTVIKAVDGSTVTAPPGAAVETTTEIRGLKEADETVDTRDIQNSGAGLATNQKPPDNFSGGSISPGNLESGKTGGVSAGTFKGAIDGTSSTWLFIIGSIAVLAGVAGATWLKLTQGWYIAGAGVLLILLGFLVPAYGGWILLAVAVGAVAYGVYYLWNHKTVVTNLVTSVQSGANALAKYSAAAVNVFKAETSRTMDTATKDVVKQTRLDAGISDETPPTVPPVAGG